ncbi:MAG: ergothioneine biosynthesis protein EgtB [Planctomycetes bacterium]|nr:ergothioneine biosynthesis protein EgtB [Planctomycetota bacterium]
MSTSESTARSSVERLDWVRDAHQRSLELLADLSDTQLIGPPLEIVNPLLWEIGHVAWFYERWILRHTLGKRPVRDDADDLWDSIEISHDTRWDLVLPPREKTLAYVNEVYERVLDRLASRASDARLAEFVLLALFHEDMHTEAFTYTRQTLSFPAPEIGLDGYHAPAAKVHAAERAEGDARIPGGAFELGARRGGSFVLDNERWAHSVPIEPFAIARVAVTQGEFARFVEDDGYKRRELWSDVGWSWGQREDAEAPVYWKRDERGRWLSRRYEVWLPLEPDLPMLHVSWFEAEAYCRWAGRRLPTEAEWELAAAGEPADDGRSFTANKRRFPWGDQPPGPEHAHLDWRSGWTGDVHAYPAGDSAFGCRQMIGNVWEWTASDFAPYPGFEPGPYKEYSEPWFHTRKVLRGGCWVTRGRMLRNTWRNYYEPHRRDVWAGFRTCAPRA